MRRLLLALSALAAGCGGTAPAGFRAGVPEIGSLQQEERPDDPASAEQFRFDPGDTVEAFDSAGGHFKLHFARDGRNAVPAADADHSGVPDFVEDAAGIYEEVLAKYTGLGFRAPLSDADAASNGGDAKFDVYFIDFDGAADGAFRTDGCLAAHPGQCFGYMVQENDFAGYGYPSTRVANRILASHEFFHAVQAAYDAGQGSVLAEGSAVWATETFDPALDDFEGFLPGYFHNPDRTLDLPLPGPVDPFSYGSAIFFEYLSERFGPAFIVELWSACEDGAGGVADPKWMEALEGVLGKHGSSFADAFTDFATRNLFTGTAADATRGYASARNYPELKMSTEALPVSEAKLRVFAASTQYVRMPLDARTTLAAALVPGTEAGSLDGLSLVVAFKKGLRYRTVTRVADVAAGSGALDAGDADTAIVAVVNTARAGSSKKPGLCIGSVDEVEACRKALTPAPPPKPDPDPTPTPQPTPAPEGCGCHGAVAPAFALFGFMARRRRSRVAR